MDVFRRSHLRIRSSLRAPEYKYAPSLDQTNYHRGKETISGRGRGTNIRNAARVASQAMNGSHGALVDNCNEIVEATSGKKVP